PSSSIMRRTNAGARNGTSHDDAYAASTPRSAASPAASPWSGPRPRSGSRTTATPSGSAGTSWSGAATTTSSDTTSDSRRTKRGSMSSSPNGSHALGRPMRLDCPPHSTMPATRGPVMSAPESGGPGRYLIVNAAAPQSLFAKTYSAKSAEHEMDHGGLDH